jgi:hypothetical protein
MFALFVTGGALPAGGPSAVHGFQIVEEDEHAQTSSTHVRAARPAQRDRLSKKSHSAELEVPSVIEPTQDLAPPQTWMRPRRVPYPDDDDDQTA